MCPLFPVFRGRVGLLQLFLGFARRFLFAQLGPPALFAWLFIMLASPQFFVHPAAFDQLLEPTKGHSDRFPVMHAHS